ncbi:MAG: DUF4349 domain-containing protein [Oscillatoriales cyanobacterium]|nr:MAG: DUF4349 domain-containing protein [Oscillatoriales cyanobacterium]TAH23582.1 MAG: DUF4349 domain-containing protein [Oscillatoriales cyanobacterium]
MKTHIKTNSLSQIKCNLRCCTIVSNRQDACSTKTLLSCGTGILPVHKRPIENGVRSQFNPISANKSATRFAIVAFLTLSSTIALPSCGAPPSSQQNQVAAGAPQASAPATTRGEAADSKMAATPKQAKAETTATRPQLIKKAELSVVVKSIDASTKSVTNIVEKQQGDILGFQNQKPPDSSIRQTATMQIRVPQERLETTLDSLAKLGSVENRGLTAEDVTTQLVDSEARLRNLRKSEEMVLKIMDKSGSVGDVLKAAKELSNIRQSIEQIDAQLKSLRNQVAYSTISLTLEAAVSSAQSPEPSLGLRVQETWGKATHSVGELTFSLFDLGIWLLAYTPYFLVIGAGIYGFKRFKKSQSVTKIEELKPPQ